MEDPKHELEAELARLDALQNQGIRMTVCGKSVVMKTIPYLEVQTVGKQLFLATQGKIKDAQDPEAQREALASGLKEAVIRLFTVDGKQQLSPEDLARIDDADVRKIMMVFRHLHEFAVKRLGEWLAPIFPHLQSEYMGALLSSLVRPSANG